MVRSAFCLVLATCGTLCLAGCDGDASSDSAGGARGRHPHTEAVLRVVKHMERAGYHPALAESRDKSFAEEPVAWLGPWHVAAPPNGPYTIQWRLTTYHRDSDTQPHSLLLVETDARFDNQLVGAAIAEWEKLSPLGLPREVVAAGSRLIREAATRLQKNDQRSLASVHVPRMQVGRYNLRVEAHDRAGFADRDGVFLDYSNLILYFTYVEP
jgi:hypothetical protein